MKFLQRLGWLVFCAFVALAFAPGAHADDPRRVLVLYFYVTTDATGLPDGSRVGRQPEDVYPDYSACAAAGEKRVAAYEAGKVGTALLREWWNCERVKG